MMISASKQGPECFGLDFEDRTSIYGTILEQARY